MNPKTIALILAATSVVQSAPPVLPGYKLTWMDDFIGKKNSLPNLDEWIIDIGTSYPGGPPNWGTGEIQRYTSSTKNIRLTGKGTLQITPLRDANNSWTSARIETVRKDFEAREGGKMRIAARISNPDITGESAVGYWAAFWTLGNGYRGDYGNWPSVGEFDIMENVNGLNRLWGVLHCGINPGGPCNEPVGLAGNTTCPGSPCQGNYHVYSFVVDRTSKPEKIVWDVDGLEYHSVTEDDIGSEVWAQTVHQGHFLLLNLAIGGGFPNGQRNGTTPIPATVPGVPLHADWVAVYNSDSA